LFFVYRREAENFFGGKNRREAANIFFGGKIAAKRRNFLPTLKSKKLASRYLLVHPVTPADIER